MGKDKTTKLPDIIEQEPGNDEEEGILSERVRKASSSPYV